MVGRMAEKSRISIKLDWRQLEIIDRHGIEVWLHEDRYILRWPVKLIREQFDCTLADARRIAVQTQRRAYDNQMLDQQAAAMMDELSKATRSPY